jgi:DNA end-binding protein Ku
MPAVKNHQPPATPKAVVPPSAVAPPAAWAAPPPHGRPSWSGLLCLSLVSVPVKGYPAVTSTSASPFHLLHADCGQRIRYQKHCPQHGAVPGQAIVRGYEYAPDHYVIMEAEELDQFRPARDKALVLEQFVPVGDIDPTFYAGRSLYLVADGVAARHPYRVLAEAMQETGQAALSRVVLSSQRQLVLVRPCGRLLVLDVLHYPAQVRAHTGAAADRAPAAATEAERALARQLIALASAPLDWERYRDSGAEELAALIQAKLAQQPPAAPVEEPVFLNLLEALQQSVAQASQPETVAQTSAAAKSRKPRARRKTG